MYVLNTDTSSDNDPQVEKVSQLIMLFPSLLSQIYLPSLHDKVITLYDYDAQDDQELDLEEGDIITVIYKEDRTWWCGSCRGKIGMFPSTYVTTYSEGIIL